MKQIYLDHAAATPTDPQVKKAMLRGLDVVGNPSSFNDAGRQAAELLQKSRTIIGRFLNARAEEIVFTASGSEANALALKGILAKYPGKKTLTTSIEHKSVLENIEQVVLVDVDAQGRVDLSDFKRKLRKDIVLVSVMYANNEIGTIQPIREIAVILKEYRQRSGTEFPLLHVDACQATAYLNMDVHRLGADLVTMNGSKVYGPRGIGVLYVRRGIELKPLIAGGGQEQGLRAGTENLPAIIGLATALTLINREEAKQAAVLRDFFFEEISAILPDVQINGTRGKERLANNIHISIPDLESEQLLLELDRFGIAAGSGSACTARSVEPSHVLKAIGLSKKYLSGAIRFSLGKNTTKKDIVYVLAKLPIVISKLAKRYS